MRCAQCQLDDPDPGQFCRGCAARLQERCAKCGATHPVGSKFCSECGEALLARVEPQADTTGPSDRRQLTVMFCDMVGSTALSESLDPEDLRESMKDFQQLCGRAIEEEGGFIAQTMGDGLMVYFGYPRATEDDAVNAVRAGLRILQDITTRATPQGPAPAQPPFEPKVRIGIHTGLVVTGTVGSFDTRAERAVVGETPNIAARLESLAEPGTVLVGPTTYELTRGRFDYETLGEHMIKGLSKPMAVRRALRERTRQTRFAISRGRGLSPFLGRESTLLGLHRIWRSAQTGHGQTVVINGEAGIGKSRLMTELVEHCGNVTKLECQCSSRHKARDLYPLAQGLLDVLGVARSGTAEERLRQLEAALEDLDQPPSSALVVLGAATGLPVTLPEWIQALGPQKRSELSIRTLAEMVLTLAARGPLLMLVEDLHWVDDSSTEALRLLTTLLQDRPALVVITQRPEAPTAWANDLAVTRIQLSRLEPGDSRRLVERILGSRGVSRAVMGQIAERSDGVPLFIEEIARMLKSGDESTHTSELEHAVPSTILELLLARLDALGDDKKLLRAASLVGRDFTIAAIAACRNTRPEDVRSRFPELLDSGLIERLGDPAEETYRFKHALVQDAAYDSTLKEHRRQGHLRLADHFARNDTEPVVVAMHYRDSERPELSLPYWLTAGRLALSRGAVREACSYLQDGLSVANSVEHIPETSQLEIDLRLLLAEALGQIDGWAHPELERVLQPAIVRARNLEQPRSLADALSYLHVYYSSSGQHESAEALVDENVRVAQQAGSRFRIQRAAIDHLETCWFRGQFGDGIRQIKTIEEQLANGVDAPPATSAGHSLIQTWLGNYGSQLAWVAGFTSMAERLVTSGVQFAERLGRQFLLANAQSYGTKALLHLRDLETLTARIDSSIEIARQSGFQLILCQATIFKLWSQGQRGEAKESAPLLQEQIPLLFKLEAGYSIPFTFALLAETRLCAQQPTQALEAARQALHWATKTGEVCHLPELHRLSGMALAHKSETQVEAEAELGKSLRLARTLGARSWELRTATTIAGRRLEQHRYTEAVEVLGPAIAGLPETQSTPDLNDARQLMKDLLERGPTDLQRIAERSLS